MRMLLGLIAFPIIGNLLRLGSERLVKAMDVRAVTRFSIAVCSCGFFRGRRLLCYFLPTT